MIMRVSCLQVFVDLYSRAQDAIGGIVNMVSGVLNRRESLAANMGAKLMAPLLLKSFEKLFDGPIKVLHSSFTLERSPASWVDIVNFAHNNPSEFILADLAPGVKSCRFWFRGGQIEIGEDDYRLIVSGAPKRMLPTQPIPEDETAELATLNILEARLTMLIKKADAVASKARQLNYHLKGRKSAFMARNNAEHVDSTDRTLSPQSVASRSPAPPGNGDVGKVQRQLLKQFSITPPQATPKSSSIALPRPKTARVTNSTESPSPQVVATIPTGVLPYNGFSHAYLPHESTDRRSSQANTATSSDDGIENHYRVLMATKIDKLAKGDIISPPCDRCRRLKFDCIKHISACAGCTKKHARCSWKDVRDGELDFAIPPQVQLGKAVPQLQESEHYLSVDARTGAMLRTGDHAARSLMPENERRVLPDEERLYREGPMEKGRDARPVGD